MGGRGPQSFKKRQKEEQRKEKRLEKIAKRLERKQNPLSSTDTDDETLEPLENQLQEPLESDDLTPPPVRPA
jgi:hypothetical protein